MEEAKPQLLLWTVPECPFRVTIPVTLLNEIRILTVEAFYSVPRGGVEIGGAFFGIREADAVHIRAFRPIHCEYATGPSFTLSVKDQLGLSGLLDEAPADPELAGLTLLGWYHSHTRSDLFLSPADLQLYKEFFHEKWQIAAVMRPANFQPTRAAIFFRDRWGDLKSDAPVKEFKLEPPNFGLTLLDAGDSAAVPEVAKAPIPQASSAPPPPARKSPPEPPPIPLSSLAPPIVDPSAAIAALAVAPEFPLPQPTPTSVAAAVAATAGNGSVAAPDLTRALTADLSPEPAPEPKIEAKPETAPETPPDIGLRSFDLAESAVRERRNTGWIWALVIIILLGAGGTAAFLQWDKVVKPAGLGLETYDINGAFLIRWDRDSSAILRANHATLEIEDGDEKTPIDLSPAELAVGGYGYMRRTSQVSVRMKVDGPPPVEEFSNFKGVQALGSQAAPAAEASNSLTQAIEEKEHLKTELINESIQSSELRREITSLRKQLAEERARDTAPPDR